MLPPLKLNWGRRPHFESSSCWHLLLIHRDNVGGEGSHFIRISYPHTCNRFNYSLLFLISSSVYALLVHASTPRNITESFSRCASMNQDCCMYLRIAYDRTNRLDLNFIYATLPLAIHLFISSQAFTCKVFRVESPVLLLFYVQPSRLLFWSPVSSSTLHVKWWQSERIDWIDEVISLYFSRLCNNL